MAFARAPLLCATFFAIAPLLCAQVEYEIEMTLYIHQVVSGPATNDISVVTTGGFGTISVNDWAILDGPDPSAATVVGRGQGTHTWSSLSESSWFTAVNLVFNNNETWYGGSTLAVMGTFAIPSEWAIVGGTGTFRMARGIINYDVDASRVPPSKVEAVFKLDILAYYYSTDTKAVKGKTGCKYN